MHSAHPSPHTNNGSPTPKLTQHQPPPNNTSRHGPDLHYTKQHTHQPGALPSNKKQTSHPTPTPTPVFCALRQANKRANQQPRRSLKANCSHSSPLCCCSGSTNTAPNSMQCSAPTSAHVYHAARPTACTCCCFLIVCASQVFDGCRVLKSCMSAA
jgi:hypothetical protein